MTATIKYLPPAAGAFDPTDIEITDNTSGAWLIKDDAGTPHEYMRIDTTTGSKDTVFTVDYDAAGSNLWRVGTDRTGGSGNMLTVQSRNVGLGGIEGVFMSGPATSQVWVTGPSTFRVQSAELLHNPSSGRNFRTSLTGTSAFQVHQTTGDSIMNVAADSNTTFTLEDGSGATFTITDDSATPKLHLRCTQSAAGNPYVEVNGLIAFPTKQLVLTSSTYGTAFQGSANQARTSVSLGATSATRNVNIGAVNMDNFAQILTATPSTTGQTFTLDFNNTSTALSGLPISLYKLVLKNAGTQSCTFTAASTMAGGGRVKGVDISGASIGVIDSSSGSITAAAGETIYVEVTNHVSDSAGGNANRFIICKTICKI